MKGLSSKTAIVVAVLLALGIVPFFIFGDQLEAWTATFVATAQAHQLVTGLILAGLLAADVVLPVPSSLVSVGCGSLLGPGWGTAASMLGMTVGCMVGYWMGNRLGPLTVGRYLTRSEYERLEVWHARFGVWMLALCRPIPVLAESTTIFAGILRLGWFRFMTVTSIINLAISLLYAAAGSMTVFHNAGLLLIVLVLVWMIGSSGGKRFTC